MNWKNAPKMFGHMNLSGIVPGSSIRTYAFTPEQAYQSSSNCLVFSRFVKAKDSFFAIQGPPPPEQVKNVNGRRLVVKPAESLLVPFLVWSFVAEGMWAVDKIKWCKERGQFSERYWKSGFTFHRQNGNTFTKKISRYLHSIQIVPDTVTPSCSAAPADPRDWNTRPLGPQRTYRLHFPANPPLFSTLFNSTLLNSTLLYSSLPDSARLNSTLRNSSLLDSSLLDSSLFDSSLLDATLLNSSLFDSILLDSTRLNTTHITLLCSTLRCWTLLYTQLYSYRIYSSRLCSTLLYSALLFASLLYSLLFSNILSHIFKTS